MDRKDQIITPTSSKPSGYSESLWEQPDADARSIRTQVSANASHYSFHSGRSEHYHELDSDGASIMSRSHLAPPSQADRIQKVPRVQIGSMFFKLFKSNTELHRAAKKGDVKKLKSLIDVGADVNYEGSSGCTPLHLATDCGHEAVVRLLLANGADAAAKSSEGRTPLHSAARMGHPGVVRLLLEKIDNVHAKDSSGSTSLHIAAYNGRESVVQILLEKNPFIEVRGPSGFTALHVAAFNGQSAVVRLLVEMGADLEARSDTGRTALQLAAERGHEAVVRHLLQHGANVIVKDRLGRTALQCAVSNQHGVVAQLLLDRALSSDTSSPWQRGSSGPTYEISAVGPVMKGPVSQQNLNAPVFELAAAPVVYELPASNLMAGVGSPTSITRKLSSLSLQKRAGGT
jgi:ankyrin repeat protein